MTAANFRAGVALQDRWQLGAACRGLDPALFFPARGESTAEAKTVCASCDVDAECLGHALGQNGRGRLERFGIWGATSERERRQLRRQARTKAVA